MVLTLLTGLSFAQFGKLSNISKKSNGTAVDVDSLVLQADSVNADFLVATYALADSYATMLDIADKSEEAAKLRDAIIHAKSEQPDQQAKIVTAALDPAQRTLDAEAAKLEVKKLNDKQKRELARVSFNVAVSVLKDTFAIETTGNLIPKTADAIKQVGSNPMTAGGKLSKLRDEATSLKNTSTLAPSQVKSVSGIMGTLAKMRKTNNISDDKVASATVTATIDSGDDTAPHTGH
jgi:hypothetical protein